MTLTLSEIKQLPKVQLHDHLDGGVRPQTIVDLARQQQIRLPSTNADELAHWFYQESTAKDLQRCLAAFAISCSVMQTESALERIAYEMIEDMFNDNVRYIETRFCPYLHRAQGLTDQQIIDSVIRGLERGREEFKVEFGVLICGIRNFADEINLQMAELACLNIGKGVVGFDFAGADLGFPLANQTKTLQLLKHHNIPLTAHAGEAANLTAIIEALDCGATRIGHACNFYSDMSNPELISAIEQRILEQKIHIETNLSSNLGTGVVPSLSAHPAKLFLDQGFSIALNTDDRLMFNNTLSEEYFMFLDHYQLDLAAFKQMNQYAMSASFASEEIKSKILHDLA